MINFGVAFIAIIALIVIGGLFTLKMGENPSAEFSNYNELENSDLIKKGWVPGYIPGSAHEIKEAPNLDTSVVRGAQVRSVRRFATHRSHLDLEF